MLAATRQVWVSLGDSLDVLRETTTSQYDPMAGGDAVFPAFATNQYANGLVVLHQNFLGWAARQNRDVQVQR